MFWAAFITGLIGSLHCAGMCGPLLCAMPLRKGTPAAEWTSLLVYNTGRLVSYGLLGVLMGMGGFMLLKITGVWFTYIAGALLLGLGLYKLMWGKRTEPPMPVFMRKAMGRLFRWRSPFTLPLLGMLNGFIPCGVVYAALAGASVTASPVYGGLYMLVFGLGTWPALFSSYYLWGRITQRIRKYYRPATAIFMCLLGVLLWVRAWHSGSPRPEDVPMAVCR